MSLYSCLNKINIKFTVLAVIKSWNNFSLPSPRPANQPHSQRVPSRPLLCGFLCGPLINVLRRFLHGPPSGLPHSQSASASAAFLASRHTRASLDRRRPPEPVPPPPTIPSFSIPSSHALSRLASSFVVARVPYQMPSQSDSSPPGSSLPLVPSERRRVRIDVGVDELGDDPTGTTCLSDGRTKN